MAERRVRPSRRAVNDNASDALPRERVPQSPLRLAARILIAPLYLIVALASAGIIALTVKSALGL